MEMMSLARKAVGLGMFWGRFFAPRRKSKYHEVGILEYARISVCLRLFKLCSMGSARHAACREDICKAWTTEENNAYHLSIYEEKGRETLVES